MVSTFIAASVITITASGLYLLYRKYVDSRNLIQYETQDLEFEYEEINDIYIDPAIDDWLYAID
jgi:hypothetical protein